MNLALTTGAAVSKTSAFTSFWLGIVVIAIAVAFFFTAASLKAEGAVKQMQATPWEMPFQLFIDTSNNQL